MFCILLSAFVIGVMFSFKLSSELRITPLALTDHATSNI